MSEELKPCDCGGQVEIVSANNCDFRIYCNAERKLKRCWATSKGELIEIWNARPEDNRIAEVEEKLRIKDDVITAKGLLIEALQAKLTATEQKLAKAVGKMEYAEKKLRSHHSSRGGILVIADRIKATLKEIKK